MSGGRDIANTINDLLSLPFALKVATKDYHPENHISFLGPNDEAFKSTATMTNPSNPSETKQTPIWPVHCVAGTPGSDFIPEINSSAFDFVVEKGRDKRVEMYSGFADAFGNKSDAASVDLAAKLSDNNISHLYVVGLTGDCCVKATAIDGKRAGFEVYVLEEVQRSVIAGEDGWVRAKKEMAEVGVMVVSVEGPEVKRLRGQRAPTGEP